MYYDIVCWQLIPRIDTMRRNKNIKMQLSLMSTHVFSRQVNTLDVLDLRQRYYYSY